MHNFVHNSPMWRVVVGRGVTPWCHTLVHNFVHNSPMWRVVVGRGVTGVKGLWFEYLYGFKCNYVYTSQNYTFSPRVRGKN